MLLDLAAIEQVEDIKTTIVDMKEEWGGDVKIRALNFAQQIEFEKKKAEIKDNGELILLLLQMSIINNDNQPMFNDSSIKVLKSKKSQALFKLFSACLAVNGLDEKSTENNAKNS